MKAVGEIASDWKTVRQVPAAFRHPALHFLLLSFPSHWGKNEKELEWHLIDSLFLDQFPPAIRLSNYRRGDTVAVRRRPFISHHPYIERRCIFPVDLAISIEALPTFSPPFSTFFIIIIGFIFFAFSLVAWLTFDDCGHPMAQLLFFVRIQKKNKMNAPANSISIWNLNGYIPL